MSRAIELSCGARQEDRIGYPSYLFVLILWVFLSPLPALAGNPVVPAPGADPHAALLGDRYWLFATGAGREGRGFAAWSSPDLRNWTKTGMALRFADVPWAKKDDWAPAIAARNGRYYLYWGAVPYGRPERATKVYNHLFVRKLKADMISFDGEELPTVETLGPHIEGSFVFKRNGLYYLMWSTGSWNAADERNAYRVEYATAPSPLGPWKRAGNDPVLASSWEEKVIGPGHHSVIQIPGTDEWRVIYHAHPGNAKRTIWVDRMEFAGDGSIRTIVPTREGPPPVPVIVWLGAESKGPYSTGNPITLRAETLWPVNQIARLELFDNGNKLDDLEPGDGHYVWKNPPAGFHRLYVRATSISGQVAQSGSVDLDVIADGFSGDSAGR